MHRLEPQVRTIWLLGDVLEALVVTAITLVLELTWFGRYTNAFIPLGGVSAVVGIPWLALAVIMPPLKHRAWRYAVRPHDVVICYGVLWKMRRTIPRPRIQHVDIESGPIHRAFGLARLSLFTAGTITAVAVIPGIRAADAEALREQLLSSGDRSG